MTLEIIETHKKVLEIIAMEDDLPPDKRRFSLLSWDNFKSPRKTFSDYKNELFNNGYLTGRVVDKDDRQYYVLSLTNEGKKLIEK